MCTRLDYGDTIVASEHMGPAKEPPTKEKKAGPCAALSDPRSYREQSRLGRGCHAWRLGTNELKCLARRLSVPELLSHRGYPTMMEESVRAHGANPSGTPHMHMQLLLVPHKAAGSAIARMPG